MIFSPIVLADQINRFNCGGLVIGLCVSHWVADGHAIGSFLEAWATVCRARMHEMICSSFQAGGRYPATDVLRLGTPVPGYICYKSDCHKKKKEFFFINLFLMGLKNLNGLSWTCPRE
jgi:hypothetical protein